MKYKEMRSIKVKRKKSIIRRKRKDEESIVNKITYRKWNYCKKERKKERKKETYLIKYKAISSINVKKKSIIRKKKERRNYGK